MTLLLLLSRTLIRRGFCSAASATQPSPTHIPTSSPSKRLITCKNKALNLLRSAQSNTDPAKFGSIALASQGWTHRKAKGDFFVLHPNEPTNTSTTTSVPSFSSLGLDTDTIRALQDHLHITCPTPYQAQALPLLLQREHVVLAAETGCGKTLAYLLPILHSVRALRGSPGDSSRRFNTPLALVLTPGRELAAQVSAVAERMGLRVQTVVGGHTKRLLLQPSFEDVDVLVGSLGAVSKLVTHGIYRMGRVRTVVLDEADTLLDDSFNEKLAYFLRRFPFHRLRVEDMRGDVVGTQLVLASATLPRDYGELLRPVLNADSLRLIASPHLHQLRRTVPQRFLRLNKSDRPSQLLGLAKAEAARGRPMVVFANKTPSADFVSLLLNEAGVSCLNLTGDMQVSIREGRFEQFQRGECAVLSTTDVGSRGLDTSGVAHVVNFDFPLHVADYIHRCGRVGRVGSRRDAQITHFVSSAREVALVQRIEHAARTDHALPDVNANITGIIREQILRNMGEATGGGRDGVMAGRDGVRRGSRRERVDEDY